MITLLVFHYLPSQRQQAQSVEKKLNFEEISLNRVFLAESVRMKKEWLDCIENAKRELLHEGSLVRQATIRGKRQQDLSAKMEVVSQLIPVAESATTKSPDESAWLSELPAELDDCIAHRDMEHAVFLRSSVHKKHITNRLSLRSLWNKCEIC